MNTASLLQKSGCTWVMTDGYGKNFIKEIIRSQVSLNFIKNSEKKVQRLDGSGCLIFIENYALKV
jgi:hypothetical protein